MARRYAKTPDSLVSDPTDHPVEAAWFRLMMARLCSLSAMGVLRQFIAENKGKGIIQLFVPAPGV